MWLAVIDLAFYQTKENEQLSKKMPVVHALRKVETSKFYLDD
jgi:hypothetical protein